MLRNVLVAGVGLAMTSVAGAALQVVNLTYQAPSNTAANFSTTGAASWTIGNSVSTFLSSYYAITPGNNGSNGANFNYRYDDASPGGDTLNRIGVGTNYSLQNASLIFKFTTDPGLEFTGGTITVSGYVDIGGSNNPVGLNPRIQTGADLSLDGGGSVNGFNWIGSPTDTQGYTYDGVGGNFTWTLNIPTNVSTFYLAIEDNGQNASGSALNDAFYIGNGSEPMASSIKLNATVAAVPEPGMLGALGLGLLALRRRGRA